MAELVEVKVEIVEFDGEEIDPDEIGRYNIEFRDGAIKEEPRMVPDPLALKYAENLLSELKDYCKEQTSKKEEELTRKRSLRNSKARKSYVIETENLVRRKKKVTKTNVKNKNSILPKTARPPKKKHICDVCNKEFIKSSKLKRHQHVHTGERPFVCYMCNKAFREKGHLKRHIVTHTGDRPYPCTICQKLFSQSGTLKRHLDTHTGERRYTCEVCNKGFLQSGHLKMHMLIHNNSKPYKCEICDKAFSQRSNLKTHMLTHNDGVLPHSCDVCRKGFLYSSSLERHRIIHTDERPYVCHICKKGYQRPSILKKHLLIHTRQSDKASDLDVD